MPGQSLIGSVATLDSSSVTWPEKPGSMKPAVEWVSRPSRPSDDLPSSRAATSSGSVTTSYVDAEHELARVQDERLVAVRLDQPGQVGLLVGRVDVRVPVVLEDPEEPVEADVDAGRLDHRRVVRVEADPAGVDLGPDVAVGEQHGRAYRSPQSALPGEPSRPRR